jgi:2-keto-4-pentenoate hydratase/2-oxohepta-3-ene-1,7-dioic acid hydratase in catechol pathway
VRLASFRHDGQDRVGQLVDDVVVELQTPGITDLIRAGLGEVPPHPGAQRYAQDEIEWLPVIPRPGKILCIGLNYDSHREESSRPTMNHPTVFPRYADSQVGHLSPLVIPHESTRFDYEGELAVIIGRGGRRIPEGQALDHVAGYACYNDGSVRDWQKHTSQFMPGKTFPGTGGFGPYLVTPDEVGALDNLKLSTRVNGEVRQAATLNDLIFGVPELIAYISAFTPLAPGDVIVTGTPSGVGLHRTPQVFLEAGDVVEVEIDVIGTLTNPVVTEGG